MKKSRMLCALACFALLVSMSACALAYDAQMADSWLAQFAEALSALAPLNDPTKTADPARAGQMLIEYEFGTVLAASAHAPSAQQIMEIDVRTGQVTDCRGVRVGMPLDAALEEGAPQLLAGMPLQVLGTQEAGYGWCWAYGGDEGIYGVEYITYGGDEASGMKEYTLTYVITDGTISAIRMKMAGATPAQAQEGQQTADEMAQRQRSEVLARESSQPIFGAQDLTVMGGAALGVPVSDLVRYIGEPMEVQSLPNGAGRILIYDGAVVRLALHEATGEEIVRGVSVSSAAMIGPRGMAVGMDAQSVTALFACEQTVGARGGTLYLAGEAAGEAPYGEIVRMDGGELLLRYTCVADNHEVALLEAGISGGRIAYWHLTYLSDAKGGM